MNIKQKLVAGATAASMALSLLLPVAANAAVEPSPFGTGGKATKNLNDIAGTAGLSTTRGLPETIGTIINIALSLLGIIFLILALYAGFQWMTAQGDTKKVEGAQTTLKNAVVGLIVIMLSYALSTFIITQLYTATGGV